jgi:subtilisin family serine protease
MVTRSKPHSGDKPKMSASMAALIESQQWQSAVGESMLLARPKAGTAGEQLYHVFIRCSDRAAETVAGVKLGQGAGTVKTALVRADQLFQVAASDEVERMSAPRLLRPLLDVAAPLVGAPKFRAKHKVSGKDVIVGIVDSGIDVLHPGLAGRVLALWDQVIPGQGPGPGFSPFGTVLTGPAMAVSSDVHGHGTHVAGIAAGNGQHFDGIATGAHYLIVKTNFQNTAIVEGVRWIFAEAQKLGRPCVINLSLGGHFDSHDGQDDMSVAIADECGPGRLVVAAAGNEGGEPIHTHQLLTAAHPARLGIQVKPRLSPAAAPYFLVNGWYGGAGECEVRAVSSTGATTPWQGLIATDPAARSYVLANDRVLIATPDMLAPNGDRQFLVEVQSQTGAVQGGIWKVEVRQKIGNAGDLHAWLLLDPERPDSAGFTAPADDHLIGSPGACLDVITVASYTCRNNWVDLSGAPQAVGLTPDSISEFSSPGPLRGGVLKPDVTAPGAMIASCLALNSIVEKQNVIAERYRMMAGTSMASPVVAGLLALLLESAPNTTPQQAKDWLRKNCKIPNNAANTHDIKWGYGLVKV